MHDKVLSERSGMRVVLNSGVVTKYALDEANLAGINNAYRFYKALSDTKYVPKNAVLSDNILRTEYVEEQYVNDNTFHENFRRECIRLIFELRNRGIWHGDLTSYNYIIRDNVPVVIDWDQSNFVFEDMMQKRPKTDAYHLYKTIPDKTGDVNRIMRRWLVIRDYMEPYKGWGKVVDLGTYQGDTAALAQSEFFFSTGVDIQQMRTICIQEAKEMWEPYGCRFVEKDIVDFDCTPYDIAIMFSTWAYIVRDHGKEIALKTLQRIINQVDMLFFETQLLGDGPGPEFLKTDDDTKRMLSEYASVVEPLITIPVYDREALRTTWLVKR